MLQQTVLSIIRTDVWQISSPSNSDVSMCLSLYQTELVLFFNSFILTQLIELNCIHEHLQGASIVISLFLYLFEGSEWHIPEGKKNKQKRRCWMLMLVLFLFFSLSTCLHVVPADVTQKTVTLAIHSEEPATVSNSPLDAAFWGNSSYGDTHTHTNPNASLIIIGHSLSVFPSLSTSPLLFFRSGQMEHLSTLAPGVLVQWQNDLLWKCQVHQRKRVIELIKETEE